MASLPFTIIMGISKKKQTKKKTIKEIINNKRSRVKRNPIKHNIHLRSIIRHTASSKTGAEAKCLVTINVN